MQKDLRIRLIILISAVILTVIPLLSKAQDTSYRLNEEEDTETEENLMHEISLGVGYFRSFEQNLFNNTDRVELAGGFHLNLNYRFPVKKQFSLGFGIEIMSAPPKRESPPYTEDLIVNILNIGANGKWHHITNSKFVPFILFGAYFSLGDMYDNVEGYSLNNFSGYTLQAGVGVQYPLNENIALTSEVSGYFGNGKWQYYPADDSVDQDFNPGAITISIGIALLFQSFDNL